MKNITKQFYMRWDELLMMLGIELGMFLFGEILFTVVTHIFGEEGSVFEVGTMMALFAPLSILFFSGCSFLFVYFNIGISMGEVRRRFVPMILAMTYLECLLVTAGAYLLHLLEQWKFRTFYKGIENELDLGVIFQWKYILIICLAITALQAFFGMLFLKFGKSAFWVLWAVYITVLIVVPRIKDTAFILGNKVLINLFSSEKILLAGAAGISIILLAVSYFFLRKQQVTN